MKRALLFAVPFALALVLSSGARADEKEAKVEEMTMTVGCGHCNFSKETGKTACCAAGKAGDKVFVLTGKVTEDFKKGGEWTVKGKVSADGKSVEVVEMVKKEAK
jgi:hypothetical protein